jgi:preprotein translocase subunit SecA
MIANILKYLFGTANQRTLKSIQPLVNRINELESSIKPLDDASLTAKTNEFKNRIALGESLDSILPEAFAVVREASLRKMYQRHYDVQLIGGIVLHQGKISEMKTGEGKTLTATLPLYLNALTGKGVHLVTVNDYLASRDVEWMSTIYNFLGLSAGALKNSMFDSERKNLYNMDILYGTNSEFGFDYLRDNMKFRLSDYVQRELHFAIVDEADSVLIDEARTPLIISGSSDEDAADMYKKINYIINTLDAKTDFEVDEKERHVNLSDSGVDKVEAALEIKNLYAVEHIKILHHVTQSLKAHTLFKKDVDYVVMNDQVMIVDEFTGRILASRRYSDGLHQALEAKERVDIQEESHTLASITLQNYFRLYKKISGMTGTALTEAEEFHKIYNLDVVSIPTNQPVARIDKNDMIFLSEQTKFNFIVKDIKERYAKGQPVLIGTVAVETSEKLSHELKKANIPHEVLNAKQHEREADIIAHAGEPHKITIATNMAGRGTDIKLTPESKERGGLYILGTERHESRRIDNQLRGRAGRQGDPGESRFYISLDDSLIRRFGGDSIKLWMQRTGMKEDEVIEDSMISRTIETAQEKVEKHNFEIRKQIIEYDDVLNQQRVIIYRLRALILQGKESMQNVVHDFISSFIKNIITTFQEIPEKITADDRYLIIDKIAIHLDMNSQLKNDLEISIKNCHSINAFINCLIEFLWTQYQNSFIDNPEHTLIDDTVNPQSAVCEAQKWFMLEILDQAWRQHIVALENIREGIGLRGYGQKTPIIEYKQEAFALFKETTHSITEEIISKITKINIKDFNSSALEQKRERELEAIRDSLHITENNENNTMQKTSLEDLMKMLNKLSQKKKK